jgi:hypothetical protein
MARKKELKRNEVILNCDLKEFEKLIKKLKGNLNVIQVVDEPITLDEAEFWRSEPIAFFIFSKADNKLIFNPSVEDEVYNRCVINEKFFKSLSKLTNSDFKVDVWDTESRTVIYCKFVNGELNYCEDPEDMWYEDFENYPYFMKLAKQRGCKKVKDEWGEKNYTEDDKYDIFYDFVDELRNGTGAAKIAPEWYLKD